MTSQTTKLIVAVPAALVAVAAVLLLLIPPSWAGILVYEHVHIVNELAGGKTLLAHCHSSEHDLGETYVDNGLELEWQFHPRIFRKTHWVCYVAPDNNRHVEFDAFNDTYLDLRYGHNVFWVAKEDGLYFRDQFRHQDSFSQPYLAGRIDNLMV